MIEERITRLTFDNRQFEQGIAQSLGSLNKLKQSLKMDGVANGLGNVGKTAAAQAAPLNTMSEGAQTIGERFKAMSIVATTAIATVAHQAVARGSQIVKSLSIDPIMQGFREYEINMNSIQTIMANTGLEGKKGLKTVTNALDELNLYADQTIYNFSEMAKNIGTFTAAGVSLDTSTAAIKGIANLAAVSGSNAEQASSAMYQLSQGISAGVLTLEDWNSVVNAGMGGKVFQNALTETARVHGVNIDDMIKKEGSFRLTLQKGWLTGDIMTETLSKFTGDLTAAQLKTMGYNEKQIKGILKMGKTATDAATKVKTMTQLIDTLREGTTSGWAQTWQLIFGDFDEAKTMFTSASEVLGGFVQSSSESRNKVLKDWKELGGRTALIDGISNAFQALISILRPIKDAFREIFPATTGKQLYEMTVSFRDFMERLKLGSQTAENLKRTFAGVFAVLGIGWEIVKQVAKTIFGLFSEVGKGSGGFLKTTASVGDFLVALHKAVKEGEGLSKFFRGLGKVLAAPIKALREVGRYLSELFKSTDSGSADEKVGNLTSKLEPLATLGGKVSEAWERFGEIMTRVWTGVQKVGTKIYDFIEKFSSGFGEALSGFDFGDLFAGINTGLFAGIVLMLRNLIGGGGAGGLMEGISDSIEGFTKSLTAMQSALNAAALLQIAIAVGILALSMNTLAKIDAEGLTRASAAITVMFGQLLGSLAIFNKFIGVAGFAKLPFVMGSLILLAAAVNVLASAVTKLAKLDWNGLAKGLTGVAVLLGVLVASLKFMPNPAGLISTSVGIIALGVGIKILASAVQDLSGLNWQELAKGLTGVGALLGALLLFTKFSNVSKGGIAQGAGIILLAAGIKILASAVNDMSGMEWGQIAKGLVTLAGSLAVITGALMLIPPTAPIAALGVLGVAISLGMIAKALAKMGQMSWGGIAKSMVLLLGALTLISAALWIIPPTAPIAAAGVLITAIALQQIGKVLSDFSQYGWVEIAKAMVLLAGTLGIIAGALFFMTTALPGAAATLVVATALSILAPILMQFGQMSLGEIGKSLLMLAGVFIVFGGAALLLAPLVPIMIGLAGAITLLGIGILAAGAGVLLFATGLTALAGAGVAATAALVGIVSGLAGLIPMVLKQIGLGLIAFAEVIGTAGPTLVKAIKTILLSIVKAITDIIPKISEMMNKMLLSMLKVMLKYLPNLVSTGMKLITAVLDGIAKNLPKLMDSATRVAVKFIEGVSRNLPKIIDAGFKMVIKFIDGITRAIDANAEKVGAAGGRLAVAIVQGMVKGISGGLGQVTAAAGNLAQAALSKAKSTLGIHSPSKEFEKIGKFVVEGFRKGLDGNKEQINTAFNSLRDKLKELTKNSGEDVAKLTAKLKKLHSARKKDVKAIKETEKALAQARKEKKYSIAAYSELTKKLNDERDKLGKLAGNYDKVTEKLKAAQETLKNAQKTRDDYNASVREQYSDMPSATGETKLEDYIEDLKKQVEDTKVFSNAIQRLRNLGLNDEMYKDLLATGVSALPFVQELLAGGKGKVNEINALNKQLDAAGSALGKTASKNLYEAAVQSAAGIVKGLQKQQAAIEKQMDKIADAMVRAIKKKLKIKSPSRVFEGLGGFTMEGFIGGIRKMLGGVESVTENVGDTAIEGLRSSLSGMSDLITPDMDMRPTITPVLDLSGVRKEAGRIGGLLTTNPIDVDASYAKASYVARGHMKNLELSDQDRYENQTPSSVQFVQNNYSPKALSPAELYRQTSNQLSSAKGALPTSANNRRR